MSHVSTDSPVDKFKAIPLHQQEARSSPQTSLWTYVSDTPPCRWEISGQDWDSRQIRLNLVELLTGCWRHGSEKKPLMEKETVTETEVLDKAVDGSSGGHLQVQWWSRDFGPLTQSRTRYRRWLFGTCYSRVCTVARMVKDKAETRRVCMLRRLYMTTCCRTKRRRVEANSPLADRR